MECWGRTPRWKGGGRTGIRICSEEGEDEEKLSGKCGYLTQKRKFWKKKICFTSLKNNFPDALVLTLVSDSWSVEYCYTFAYVYLCKEHHFSTSICHLLSTFEHFNFSFIVFNFSLHLLLFSWRKQRSLSQVLCWRQVSRTGESGADDLCFGLPSITGYWSHISSFCFFFTASSSQSTLSSHYSYFCFCRCY